MREWSIISFAGFFLFQGLNFQAYFQTPQHHPSQLPWMSARSDMISGPGRGTSSLLYLCILRWSLQICSGFALASWFFPLLKTALIFLCAFLAPCSLSLNNEDNDRSISFYEMEIHHFREPVPVFDDPHSKNKQ